MPLLTTVIDDKSPLILYDNTWLPGTSWDDQWAMDYYLGTFTTNNVTDGSVTFNFNGTEIWVYGAHRPNHGTYTVQLDSSSYANLSGGGSNAFQQSLFNNSVSQGSHTLKLTNTGSGSLYVDIDLIVWQSEVGNTGDQLVSETVQDTDSRFQYQEPAWTTNPPTNTNFNYFYNGTGHSTSTYSASVTFTFTVSFAFLSILLSARSCTIQGEAISLYGTSGPDNGPYSAQLDSGNAITYNASNVYPTNYAVMLYHADNLGSGSHQLVLTNLPASPAQSLSIDYAELWTTSNSTTTPSTPNATSNPQNLSSSSNLGSGAIAGIVIAAAAAVLCAAAAILFYRRWKAALATQESFYRLDTPQPRLPEVAMVAATATGVSSSIETRSDGGLFRNDASSGTAFGAVHQPANNHTAQYYETVPLSSNSRDSRSIIDTG
ncbi:hypothetical protein JVU11DRAFT_2528 [Chiua virens]|nr:hypothetical protein JVU11DRAFT_2528 [Chiua virens]